jgi:maltooligosyltrehalose trehalohydrolase
MPVERRLPIGGEIVAGGVDFRVWAPACRSVELVLSGVAAPLPLAREVDGYFSLTAPGVGAGALYWFRLDGEGAFPDPASRFQPEGPEGPSQVVDPAVYRWRDEGWLGPAERGQVFYELHVGTFTRAGTWSAAAAHLRELAELGVTAIEVMPVAEFAGEFGWGYDGVDPFAPTRLYGAPDDFRAFVDAAHELGLSVVLDVVYNHFGPRGCYLRNFAASYFTDRHRTDWGEAIDYDGPGSGPVRELVLANVRHWIDEYHLDGLRLDATHAIFDDSPEHIVAAVARRAREAAGGRRVLVVAENEPQEARLVRAPHEGGLGVDAMWNDDFHHSARVAATGRREAYYEPYHGTAHELLAALRHGFLYQGQLYPWQGKRRGTPALDLPAHSFVHFLENHDQVANAARGLRLHRLTAPARYRALTALLLLGPQQPLLFQGQEFASSAPFVFFADHPDELGHQVREGRLEFLAQFPSLRHADAAALVPDPRSRATFEACKLDRAERDRHGEVLALHRDLLRLRREDRVLAAEPRHMEGAVLSAHAFIARFFAPDGDDRLLVVNLGADLDLPAAAEPLLGPTRHGPWRTLWSSEDPRYGGSGTPELDSDERGWRLPGESAVLLAATGAGAGREP